MKRLKNYTLLPFALAFILLGAALPYLTSQLQDSRISGLQKDSELSSVNLTLRQEGDVGPVLQLMSKKHTEGSWKGETVLAEGDASHAALAVAEELNCYGLLSEMQLKKLEQTDMFVEPQLLVGEDGSSALIWACTWDDAPGTFITLDDATGKAVRILADSAQTETDSAEDIYIRLEKWYSFFRDYYDIQLMETKEDAFRTYSSTSNLFNMCFSSKDGTAVYNLNLEITDDCVFFNYCQ